MAEGLVLRSRSISCKRPVTRQPEVSRDTLCTCALPLEALSGYSALAQVSFQRSNLSLSLRTLRKGVWKWPNAEGRTVKFTERFHTTPAHRKAGPEKAHVLRPRRAVHVELAQRPPIFQMAAAPQAPGRGSVRKTRPPPVKTSLNNPYATCWGALEQEDMHFILRTLEDRFKSLGLQKVEDRKRKKKQPPLGKESGDTRRTDADTGRDLEEKRPEGDAQTSGWTPAHVRKQLAIGVNEVTRALEKNELLLVLACKSARPAMVTAHLVQLSASRGVPAGQVPRLSERIAPVVGLKCILALGFRKNTTAFADEVKAIIPRVPPLKVPWLQDLQVTPEDPQENTQTESLEGRDKEILETSFEDLSKPKRKNTEGQQSVVLQPLKIKKLIPNPNKIRKPPKSKKMASK
uniref:Ribonuclease P/MRP subunit p38 n=1 Tax=Catagonus wagneri TaxID=51154 RepID=A0A8C3VQQ9_9CETA